MEGSYHTLIFLKIALFVVAFFPSRNPAFAKIHDPVHTVKMYVAFGACFRTNSVKDGSTRTSGPAAILISSVVDYLKI